MTEQDTPPTIDEILDELVSQVEWSVDVPGAVLIDREKENNATTKAKAQLEQLMARERIQVEIDCNEAWFSLDRMIDPRELILEVGGLEFELQKLQSKHQEDK